LQEDDFEKVNQVSRQSLIYSVSGAQHDSVFRIWEYFKKNPGLTIVQGYSEFKFLLKGFVRVCLRFLKN
jgi:hypothetical protein